MAFEDLPSELLQFVELHIDSIEKIFILQLLQEDPNRIWTISELTKELRSADTSVERRLDEFYSKGVLLRPIQGGKGRHAFLPASDAMEKSILLLLKTFKERSSRIVEFIYTRPPKNLLAFADAFKFRKDEE